MFARPLSRFYRLAQLSWADRLLLLEATFWLACARTAVLTLPFRRITQMLQQEHGATPKDADLTLLALSQKIGWAICVLSQYTPWRSNCLAQALAGKIMLRRRGIASTLYLGVAKGMQSNLEAHAWLRSGETILTGGYHLAQYTVIVSFRDR